MATAFATDPFKPATREQLFLRMAITGPAGSGKTWTAMAIAAELGKVAVIDTEHGSARKYGKEFTFNVIELPTYDPREYIKYIKAAAQFGYDVIVIDSLSHAWNAAGGILDMVDKKAKSSSSGNKFTAWADATPIHNLLIEAILSTPVHIIATMRSKTEYVMEKNHQGKEVPRKVGLAPIQRDGMEFEFDIVAEMDMENNFMVSKSRCSALHNAVITKPGKNVAEIVKGWLSDGEPAALKIVEPPTEIDKTTGEIIDSASSDLDAFLGEPPVKTEALPISVVPADTLDKAYGHVKDHMDRPTFDGIVVLFDDVKPDSTATFISKRVMDTRKAQIDAAKAEAKS